MGPWIPAYTVALEDQRFYKHCGVDAQATLRALLHGRGGASTITQQLVKMATGRRGQSYPAKFKEALVAFQIEWRWTKPRILEAYLNRLPYGNRLIGVEAAAQAYFEKPAANLTQPEALFLVGLPQAPSRLNPWKSPGAAEAQFQRTVRLLRSRNQLAPDAPQAVPGIERHLPRNLAPQYLDALQQELGVKGSPPGWHPGVYRCTLDLDLQKKVQSLARAHIAKLNRADISQTGVVVLENRTGAVLALVGSKEGPADPGGENAATNYRNCGSTLKPFLYLEGIEQRRFTAATVFPDTADAVRDVYKDYDPHNFVLRHLGPVRLREALAGSLNVPAVVALGQLGARPVFQRIRDWGVRFDRSLENAGAGFILGNVGVRLVDLCGAYAGLARGGLRQKASFLEVSPPATGRVASEASVSIITDILCDNDARFYSFGLHSPVAVPGRVAVKTGTSAGYRDAWTVGFTVEHTLGVWVGNFNAAPMSQAASVLAAAPLWRMVLDECLSNDKHLPVPDLPRTTICALSGLLPAPASSRTLSELFLPGTEPAETAESWFTPDGAPLLPGEFSGWCRSRENHLRASVRDQPGSLAILNPRQDAVYLLDPQLPAAQQQVEFRVSQPRGAKLMLNGEALEVPRDGRVLWQLREGQWTLEVSNAGTAVTRHFTVKQP
jgi:penicillin-binding protein 1C